MIKTIDLALLPSEAADEIRVRTKLAAESGTDESNISGFNWLKRSIDARGKQVLVRARLQVFIDEPYHQNIFKLPEYQQAAGKQNVVIVGAGPAGLFAALRLLEAGLRPIIIERGKDVRARRRDLAAINKDHIVNPESNYCFGEGGAGTYSDGKLYTRSVKRGNVEKILQVMAGHGATPDIMVDAHPHIGTNKLPKLIEALRQTIIEHGGIIRFNEKVTGLLISDKAVNGVELSTGEPLLADAVILATGHSARDVFQMLNQAGVEIEAKPFALGVRVEHPQQVIDSIQYHCALRGEFLPAAPYNVAVQVQERGVYSFCMCPGGFIVPSATAPGEIVVNGMSPSKRNSPYANSGLVVAVELADLNDFKQYGPLAALHFQTEVEQAAWRAGGRTQAAPAQRLMDFIAGKLSPSLPATSYQPGIVAAPMSDVLPKFIHDRLQKGLIEIGKKMKGFNTNEAILVGVESRTSSPVRIPRGKETLEHTTVKNLYPCGEGAGYAGGIVSAAIDGERCAEAILLKLKG